MANAFVQDSYKLVFPLLCSGYLELDYDESVVVQTTSDLESSGVLVNGAVNNGASTTIAVDTVNATTKFAINDTVYTSGNVLVGTISAVTSTQITLDEVNKTALSDDDNLKRIKPAVLTELRERSIWNHDANFTIEAIITPYDVNGVGTRLANAQGVLDSQRTPPYPSDNFGSRSSTYESVAYLGDTNYLTQKMMIFHNQYVKLYLQNTTDSSYNQPAEYKVVAEVSTSAGTTPISTDSAVITASTGLVNYYDSSAYYQGATAQYQRVDASASGSGTSITLSNANLGVNIGKGNNIYDASGTFIGKVTSVSGTTVNLAATIATAVTSTIYTEHLKEALYLEDMFKISLVFLKNGSMELYVNNTLEKKISHTLSAGKLHPSDCKIGRGSSNQEQFFGELFEIAMHKGNKPCATVNTLTPSFSDILFYYTFGD